MKKWLRKWLGLPYIDGTLQDCLTVAQSAHRVASSSESKVVELSATFREIVRAEKVARECETGPAVARSLSAEAKVVELSARLAKMEDAHTAAIGEIGALKQQLEARSENDRNSLLRKIMGAQAELVDWDKVG